MGRGSFTRADLEGKPVDQFNEPPEKEAKTRPLLIGFILDRFDSCSETMLALELQLIALRQGLECQRKSTRLPISAPLAQQVAGFAERDNERLSEAVQWSAEEMHQVFYEHPFPRGYAGRALPRLLNHLHGD
jgi:hypothetical protein